MKEPYSWGVIGVAAAIAFVLAMISGSLAFLFVVGIAIYGWWRKRSRANSAAKELLSGSALSQLDSQLTPLKPFAV